MLRAAPLVLALLPSSTPCAQLPAAGRLAVEARDGTTSSRALAGLDVAGLAELGAIVVRFEGCAAVARADGAAPRAEVRASGGDVVYGALLGGDGEHIEVELDGGARLAIGVDDLRRITFTARVGRAAAEAFEAPAGGDRLYWARPSGFDRVDGTLEKFSAAGVEFDSALGSRTFPWAEVAALFVEALGEPAAAGAPTPARVCAEFADGGRLHAELVRLSSAGARLRWRSGAPFDVPLGALAELSVDDGSIAYLSERAPASVVEGWPPDDRLGMQWPYQVDRSVTADALRAGGRTWSRGLGVHAPSRIEWVLDGSWSALRGAVAIDDSVLLLPYRGSVEFALYLDGAAEAAWKSGQVRGGDAPLALPALALAGVKRIALVVDMNERSYVADRADWLRLLLVR